MKKRSLTVSEISYMVEQWDFEKNTLDINTTPAQSEDPAFWHCKICDYKWTACIKGRYRSSGLCPCHESNKVIKKGVNDILTLVPDLADEYDFDNNPDVDIYSEGVGSQKHVNWFCKVCGKTWSTSLCSRISKNKDDYSFHRCTHYNTVKRIKIPYISEVPKLIDFWDYDKNTLDPAKTKSNSIDCANWICPKCDYDWPASIRSRERSTGKCPCCELYKVTVPGINDLFTVIPELKEWYMLDKNGKKGIDSISIRDQTNYYWWKCPECGNESYCSPSSRIDGTVGNYRIKRCKRCYLNSSDRITPISSIPSVMKFWDHAKNKNLNPDKISVYDNETEPAWKCKECGYEWNQTPKNRKHSGKCPCCEDERAIIIGVNDLFTLFPSLNDIFYKEENPEIDISSLRRWSRKPIHWHCKNCGNQWNGDIRYRIKIDKNGKDYVVGCPKCNRKQNRALSYAEEFPRLKEMWDEETNGISFEKVNSTLASKRSFRWICPQCNNPFDAWLQYMIEKYDSPDKGCFYCSGYRVDPKRTSLKALFPDIAKLWSNENEDTPDQVFPTHTLIRKWHCDVYNLEYPAPINEMVAGKKECPYCSGKRAAPGRTSLLALYPEIAKMWSPNNEKSADHVLPNVSTETLWVCPECNNEFWGRIKEIVDGEKDCPYCNDRIVDPKRNSLKALFPQIAYKWSKNNTRILERTSPYSTTFVNWDCDICGNDYPARVCDMVSGEADCPYCNLRKVIPDKTSFKAIYPEMALIWSDSNNRQSDQLFPESTYMALWHCPDCNNDYPARVCDMVSGEADCPYCNNRKVMPGFNSFAVRHKDLMEEWDSVNNYLIVDPDTILENSFCPVWWICKNDKTHHYPMPVEKKLMFQKRNRESCPYCKGLRVKKRHFI